MSYRAARLMVASGLALWGSTGQAQTIVTPLFPGITHIRRTEQYPPFQCPGCPAPTPNPRLALGSLPLTYTRAGRHWYDLSAIKIDGAPPVLSGLPSEECTLWPTDHKLQRVAILHASDAGSGIAQGSVQVNATSNDSMDPSDVAVTEDENGGLIVELRAERPGDSKTGRVYHLTATARDLAGNEVTATATCTVPHDQGKEK